ncbi:MAG: CCA tRNA nucleotidyltransferase [Firmicutes bacterium]|nr:CCA tRNA nucleotidyltransferase [Bacillota bacterium]
MNSNNYKDALKKIAWGYVFLYFNLNFGLVDILPAWVGYILIQQALDGVAEREPSAKLLNPFAFVLITVELIRWVILWFAEEPALPWISVLTGIIGLYFHFQLLTNLADTATRACSAYGRKIRFYRTLQVLLVTVLTMMDMAIIPAAWEPVTWGVLLATAVLIIGLVWTLFSYAKEPDFQMEIPEHVQYILSTLNKAGHEAYIVGGCVRDALMGKEPNDWDVCTSALPEETKTAFSGGQTIDTGLKHGTVTVLSQEKPVEITTYRIDGEYEDSRHPKAVEFTRSLQEDLARRDFTINAMAYHPDKGIIDLYGGRDDLHRGYIRCVGEPRKRFQEDALRIMRGLRFAATLNFAIDSETADAMYLEKERLQNISKERINVELSKLILGDHADLIVRQYIDILQTAAEGMQLPQTDISAYPPALAIRLAEVFPKDTGKYLRLLKYDGNTIRWARVLSRLRNTPAPTEPKKEMVKFLHKHGEIITAMHYARAGTEELAALGGLLQQNPCYKVSDLAVNGHDLIEAGINPGPALGYALNHLLDLVMEEEIPNEKNALLAAAKEARKNE